MQTSRPSETAGLRVMDGTVRGFLAESLRLPAAILSAAFLTRRLGAAIKRN